MLGLEFETCLVIKTKKDKQKGKLISEGEIVGLYLRKENFMWPTFEDETHVLSFLFHVLSFLFVKVTF